jgi:hexulose-6-phosphate isomerase
MTDALNRRDFLKLGGAAVAAGALGSAAAVAAEPARKREIRKAIMYATIGYQGSVMEKFKAIRAAGFEGVEPMSHMNQDEVLKALDETGLKAASVCCNTHWGKPLSHPDEKMRREGLEGLEIALKDAKKYGATSVLLVPGVVKKEVAAPVSGASTVGLLGATLGQGSLLATSALFTRRTKEVTYDDCFKRSVAEIRKALPLAEELGVKIAIENVWNEFITTPEQAKEFLDAIDSPLVGWHFDIGNAVRYSPPETWIPVLGKRILKLHIKEFSKDPVKRFNVKFFEGSNNWPAIMKALDEAGYQGWGISEQPGNQAKDADSLKDLSERMDRVFAS